MKGLSFEMRSAECDRIRDFVHDRNRVLLSFPATSSYARARASIGEIAESSGPATRILSFEATAEELRLLCARLGEDLTPGERARGRALVVPADDEPTLDQYMSALSVEQLLAIVDGVRLVELIDEQRLHSALQPIFRADGTPYGHEALLRARDRDGNIIPAGAIFATAAASELLSTVDQIARRLALQAAANAGEGGVIFVNFTPISIDDSDHCARETVDFVRELGLTPSDVVFEITEGGEIRDHEELRRILDSYREAGFRVALDDIGAGFAGLTTLLELRPDIIKIDLELIRGVDQDAYRQSVVGHLIGIARDVGALSVAEGIETEAERAWLTHAGVDLLQGFLLGRPYIPAPLHA